MSLMWGIMQSKVRAGLAILLCCLLSCGLAAAKEIRFDINSFKVEGNSLLEAETIDQLLSPMTGADQDFASVQQAIETLEEAYRQRGYKIVAVMLPEQELNQGVVLLRVIEPKVSAINVIDNRHFDETNILASIPGLQIGQVPNIDEISNNLKVANEHPAKKVKLLLNKEDDARQVRADLQVSDEKPWQVELFADNSGSYDTDRYRTGVLLSHSNLFNRDHLITLQYSTSPENPSDVVIFGLGYRIPLYQLGDSLDFYAAYSDVDSGEVVGGISSLDISGEGTVAGARYNWNLTRLGDYQHSLSFGFDYRDYTDNATFNGEPIGNDICLHPVSLTYGGKYLGTSGVAGFYLSLSRNIPGGSDGGQDAFDALRPGAPDDYTLFRAGIDAIALLPKDWLARGRIRGQYSSDQLVPGEYFGVGGVNSVRGFYERELADDRGISGTIELETPNLAKWLGLSDSRLAPLVFYDFGYLDRVDALPGEPGSETVSSVGAGLRLEIKERLFGSVDYGYVLNGAEDTDAGDDRWHLRLAYRF